MNRISEGNLSNGKILAGTILKGVVILTLAGSAIAKIAGVPQMVDGLAHAGIPHGAIVPIAVLELSCLALYLIPRTAVLGALLLTGYFGGAIVTHIIGRENFLPPLIIGLWIWGGIYFRIAELSDLLPLRRNPSRSSFNVGKIGNSAPLMNEQAFNAGNTREER